jgi:hypothetical protein
MLITSQLLVFLVAITNQVSAAEFDGICPQPFQAKCVVQLDVEGVSICEQRIENDLVYQWKSSRSNPLSMTERVVKTAKETLGNRGLSGRRAQVILFGP